MRAQCAGLMLACALVGAAGAQEATPRFEVVSVKTSNRPDLPGGGSQILPGGRFLEVNQTLRDIILDAYNLQRFRVQGGPEWIDRDRFDVDGRVGRDVPLEELRLAMRTMLADRFGLVVRTEQREQGVFALRVSSGQVGPRLRPTAAAATSFRAGPGRMTLRAATMAQFLEFLSPRVDRVVVDQTGLDGRFDIDLEWTPDAGRRAALERDFGQPVAVDASVPEIFTALSEQLGLRLEAATAPVDVLIIERAERPTEN
jgi:uncharacterized protein (TIGR03435 family)